MNINLLLLNKYFQPQNILDIGAHLGEFNLHCKNFFPNASILSIEGNTLLEANLKSLNLNYIIALLGAEEKEAVFYMNKTDLSSTGNSLYRELTPHFCDENVIKEKRKINTLDNILQNNQIFDLIKIDTQGSEIDILMGGLNTLKNAKGVLLEVSYRPYNLNAPLETDVISFMNKQGFKVAEILDENFDCGQRDLLFVK